MFWLAQSPALKNCAGCNTFWRSSFGRLAQLVARLLDMEEVTGSSPVATTIFCLGYLDHLTQVLLFFRERTVGAAC